MRTFEFKDSKSNKFWNIELSGSSFTVTFGRIGTNGQTQTKTFANAATAQKEYDKLVTEKLKKGYVETTSGAPASPTPAPVISSEQKALEAALVDHADEVAAHSAYADYLMEQGDPRGEFIQVQLSLEDASRSKKERDDLREQETALLKKHAKDWLGDLGRFLIGDWCGNDKPYAFRFSRGWLDSIRVLPVPEALIASIAKAPQARLLRRLEVIYDMEHHPHGFDEFTEGPARAIRGDEKASEPYDAFSTLPALAESPYLTNLRVLKYGFSDDDEPLAHSTMVDPFGFNTDDATGQRMVDVLKKCPRLEELYLNAGLTRIEDLFTSQELGNLRVFQYYFGTPQYSGPNYTPMEAYPLSALAENEALKKLTTLHFHPGRDARIDIDELGELLYSKNLPALTHLQVHMITSSDDAVDRVISSGILKRLKTLDIAYGNLSDEGARALAACADLKNLEVLNVSRNALTRAGVNALRGVGVQVAADEQHEADDGSYLYEVDRE